MAIIINCIYIFLMEINNLIAIGSLFLSALAFTYSYLSNTKKYELNSQYRTVILNWFSETTYIITRLRLESQKATFENEKHELLAKLSSQIEIGRFYFPNIDKGNGYGADKPLAYRGYRNITLDFLVFIYRIIEEKENPSKYLEHIEFLQRHFTSIVFEILNPNKFINKTKRYASQSFVKEWSFEDFINNKPNFYDKLII